MSSVSKSSQSASWLAHFRDHEDKRINRSTNIPKTSSYRGLAEDIARFWETIAKKEHCRDDLIKRSEMLQSSIALKLKGKLTTSVTRHFVEKTHQLLESHFLAVAKSSFRVVSEEWLADRKLRVKENSVRGYRSQISEFTDFLGEFADLPLSDFDRAELRTFQRQQAARVSNKTANKKVKCICAMLRWAYKQEIIDENHADRIQHLPVEKGRTRRPFTKDEIQKILEVAGPEWQSMIRAAYTTGQRLGDIATMKWQDLNADARQWSFITRKTQKENSIPLINDFWDHLAIVPKCKRTGYVHPKAAELYQGNGGYSASSLSNQFADILFKAGLREKKVSRRKTKNGRAVKRDLETLNFHCFRYTTATMLHENGASQAIAQQILGHDCSFVHQLYVRIRPEPIRNEIEKLSLLGVGT